MAQSRFLLIIVLTTPLAAAGAKKSGIQRGLYILGRPLSPPFPNGALSTSSDIPSNKKNRAWFAEGPCPSGHGTHRSNLRRGDS